ncbi:MAG: hypothetical protein OXF67_05690 [Cyanobacteria bacterium MAG CAR4_bin_6]|nr:hypothetical protein [Cyanobacteria bacterium MAG CAR4_bin_6]
MAGPGSTGQQFEAQLAYGFPAANDRLTLTPGLALALAPDSRTYRLLWSVAPYSKQGQSQPWAVALEGERQEYLSSPAEHSLGSPSPHSSENLFPDMTKRAGGSRREDSQLPAPLIRNWG